MPENTNGGPSGPGGDFAFWSVLGLASLVTMVACAALAYYLAR